jgi:hypothetical protein
MATAAAIILGAFNKPTLVLFQSREVLVFSVGALKTKAIKGKIYFNKPYPEAVSKMPSNNIPEPSPIHFDFSRYRGIRK